MNMNRQDIAKRLKQVCLTSGITRTEFCRKYYGFLIPVSKGGINSAYASISNMLSPRSRTKVQDWLIRAIEAEEQTNANSSSKK